MVGLGVSPVEAESVGGGDVLPGEVAAAVMPDSAEGPGSGPGLAGRRSSAVGSAGARREGRQEVTMRAGWAHLSLGGRLGRALAGGASRKYYCVHDQELAQGQVRALKGTGMPGQEASHSFGGSRGKIVRTRCAHRRFVAPEPRLKHLAACRRPEIDLFAPNNWFQTREGRNSEEKRTLEERVPSEFGGFSECA